MRTVTYRGILCVISLVMILSTGCSSSGGSDANTPGYKTYTTADSDLVLKISNTLQVPEDEIASVHHYADLVPHCYATDRNTIDIALAHACIYYNMAYLYPENFPPNLNNIYNVASYVARIGLNDPFTWYFSPEEYNDFTSLMDGDAASIGFTVDCAGQTISGQAPLSIIDIEPFSRAWIDGFQTGDEIVEINSAVLNGMSVTSACLLFPSSEGEPVEIVVDRGGVEITINTAAEQNIGLLLSPDMAYLNARVFTETTGAEIQLDFEAVQAASSGTIDKLILDLRQNGGGSVSGALSLADYLINNDTGTNPIFTSSGPAFDEEIAYLGEENTSNIGNFDETRFVLLVDRGSASASETVAAALKYYDTATLAGETTYGKGIGQSVVELVDGSAVVIPSINGLPPSGVSFHEIGIDPDHIITTQANSFDDDPALEAAVEFLNTGSFPVAASSQVQEESSIRTSDEIVDPLKKYFIKQDSGYRF